MSKHLLLVLKILFWWALAGCAGIAMVAASGFLYLSPKLPDRESYTNIRLENPLRIFSADGKLLAEFGSRRSNPVEYEKIPPMVVNALISSEDKRFFDHNGVDIFGLVRSVVGIIAGKDWGGGSTITMQVTRNFFFEGESAYSRKFKEILLAIKMEKELKKEEILELYLNRTFFGISAYGVVAAARQYYDKEINELTLPEIATIIGVMPSPNTFNPLNSQELAFRERSRVLRRMRDQVMISEADFQQALDSPETARRYGRKPELAAPYIAEMVRLEMVDRYGEIALTDGFEVYTTVDSNMQAAADQALQNGLERYDRTHGYRGPENHLNPVADGSLTQWLNLLATISVSADQHPAFVIAVQDQQFTALLSDGRQIDIDYEGFKWAKRFITSKASGSTPKSAHEILTVGDLIRITPNSEGKWQLGQVPAVNGALVSLNPNNGAILALSGGYDFNASTFNRVTQARRQPGSNFKPFLYAAALDNGYTAASLINDAPLARADYRPENFGGDFMGPIRLKYALTQSKNLVSLRLFEALGDNVVLPYITRFGFKAEEFPKNDLTVAIGSHAVLPLEVATGYTVFANGGYKVEPYIIERITNFNDGEVFQAHPSTVCRSCNASNGAAVSTSSPSQTAATTDGNPAAPRVLDERTTFIMNSILKGVITEGSARSVDRAFERTDLAGKTGTTDDANDLWFSGFNSDLEATVYVGYDQPESLGNMQASDVPLPIWIDYMSKALEGKPENSMAQPDGIATMRINSRSGQLTGPGDPNGIFEYFKADQLPRSGESSSNTTSGGSSAPTVREESIF